MPTSGRSSLRRCVEIPHSNHYVLSNAHVPLCCINLDSTADWPSDIDSLVNVVSLKSLQSPIASCSRPQPAYSMCIDLSFADEDIEVQLGKIHMIDRHVQGKRQKLAADIPVVDLKGSMLLPTFIDLHTHIDKSHTCERSRNPTGCLSGADRSTDADARFWNSEDVYRRMDFSIKSCYAHGTSALRTHLINMAPVQTELSWPTFAALRKKWAGKVELQGVSLVALSFFRDAAAAKQLADTVAEHSGILGACVCCAEIGGDPQDDWTTCERDRGELLDRIFTLAKERDLDLDFHVDENGNEAAKGLLHISQKTLEHKYQGRVVCGHCCSLAAQPPKELEVILDAAKKAGITIVSLPLVNQWTQDRDLEGAKTPRWRGVTLAHEIRAAGIPFALASDNVRDQFYAYGDLDMLEVFNQGCRILHLDRPYGAWPSAVFKVPAAAMKLPDHGMLSKGGTANFVIFRGRKYSELLSRPQHDRVVVRNGELLEASVPDYRELDYVPSEFRYVLPRTLSSAASIPASPMGSSLHSPLSKTGSGPFSSFSQEQFRQAVEKEVQERLAIMRPYPEVPTTKLILWVLIAFVGTFATVWLAGGWPFEGDAETYQTTEL